MSERRVLRALVLVAIALGVVAGVALFGLLAGAPAKLRRVSAAASHAGLRPALP